MGNCVGSAKVADEEAPTELPVTTSTRLKLQRQPTTPGTLLMRERYEHARSMRALNSSDRSMNSADSRRRIAAAFEANPLLQHVASREILSSLYEEMVPMTVASKTLLFSKGEPAVMFYVVKQGKLVAKDETGTEVRKFIAGDTIGEEALLAKSERPFLVEAAAKSSLWAVDRLKFHQLLLRISRQNSAQTVSSLAKVPLLSSLQAEQLDRLSTAFDKVYFPQGTVIITKGDVGDAFYIVQSGTVVCRDERRERTLQAGEYFGEGSLLTNQPRSMDVLALTDATCFRLSCEAFVDVMAPLQDVLAYGFTQRVLSGMPLFQHLSLAELTKVTEHMTVREYSDGEFIIMQGERESKFFIVKEGRVRVARRTVQEDSGELVDEEIGVMLPGDYFGEGGILGDENYERNASCIASGPRTVCATMAREAFSECMVSMRDALASLYMVRTKLWQAPDQEEATIRATDLEVIRRLGRGNFGSVNIVRHKMTGRTYALKRMNKRMIEEKRIQKYVVNERYVLSRIRCPFVVRLHRTFRTHESVYFLMDVLIGGELTRMLQAPEMTPTAVRFYAANIALSLIYLHERGVVHRDLKAENVMLHQSGYLRLVDFGMATRLRHGARAHTMCGTPEYVAPEIMTLGSGVGYGCAVDWWAFGVLVGKMLAGGAHPIGIPDNCSLRVAWRHLVEYIKVYPHAPPLAVADPDAADLVSGLLQPNPARRLGMGKRGARSIMRHPFFAHVDWEQLANCKVTPPFLPNVRDLLDLSHFGGPDAVDAAEFVREMEIASAVPVHAADQGVEVSGSSAGTEAWDSAF